PWIMMNETRSPRVRSPRAEVKFVTRDDRVLEINRSHRLGNDPVAQCASGDSKVEELSGAAAPDDTLLALAATVECDPFDIPSTSHWTGAAIIVPCSRTKTCIVTRSRTSSRPMPSSLAA